MCLYVHAAINSILKHPIYNLTHHLLITSQTNKAKLLEMFIYIPKIVP